MGIFDSFKKKRYEEKPSEIRQETPVKPDQLGLGRWKVGDRIQNRYEIHRILGGPGKSGMGIVYICYDHEFKEAVAIKTFQDRFLKDRTSIDRFKVEAEVWVRLEKHHNIVRARYVDEIEGRPYIFLEYVVGDEQYGADLSGWIWGHGLTLPLTLNFAIQFCHGMIHADRKFKEMGKPFVHRDIKPSNIMVTRDMVVKITDFGLVMAFAESSDDISSITFGDESRQRLGLSKSGNICGTPPYMSPEQCRGEKDIDTRSDIYSFGCVLYEMVTGKYIFDVKTSEEFINHHIKTIPKPPNIQKELGRLVMKCLEKDPDKRYRDFSQLEEGLSELYHKLTGEVVNPPGSAALEAWELSNKGASLNSLGLHQEAVECYEQALKMAPGFAEAHNGLGFAYQDKGDLNKAIDEYKEALRLDPNHIWAHNNLGSAYQAQERLDEAISEYKEALRINPDLAEVRSNLGNAYAKQGKIDEGIGECKTALRINPNHAYAHNNLGNIYNDQGKLNEAIREYQQAIRVNPNYATAHSNLGNAHQAQGRLDDAIRECKEALRIKPNYADAHNNLGNAYQAQRRLDEAISEYKEALRINPNFEKVRSNLGNAYQAQGKLNEAISEYKEALRINPDLVEVRSNLGNAYKDRGMFDEAVKEHLETMRAKPNFAPVYYNLGGIYQAQGKLKEAIECYLTFVRLAPPQYASYARQAEEIIRQLKQRL